MDEPPADPRIPELVSLSKAAEMLGIGRAMTHRLVKHGQLRGRKVDGTWVFRKSVVERLAQQRSTTG